MKKILLLLTILCNVHISYSQRVHQIILSNESLRITDRNFYIDTIIDNRGNKGDIGIVQKGAFNTKYTAQLKSGLTQTLLDYFNFALPKESGQLPLTIKVVKFEISEKTTFTNEFGFADIILEFYHENKKLYNSKQHITVTSMDVTRLHEENIREALNNSIIEFNKSGWLSKIHNSEMIPANSELASESTPIIINNSTVRDEPESLYEQQTVAIARNRNIFAIGYQIGGYTLIGLNYEIRVQDYIGIHFGGGIRGYTAGIKIHTNPMKNSGFFNINFKDGGFGLIKTAGVEYGGRWVFSRKSDFGLHFQFGLAKVLHVDDYFKDILFKDGNVPDIMTSMGIGVSW